MKNHILSIAHEPFFARSINACILAIARNISLVDVYLQEYVLFIREKSRFSAHVRCPEEIRTTEFNF
jgi:hypothetical protein